MTLYRLMSEVLTVQSVGPTTTDDYGNAVPGALGAPVTVYGFLEQQTTVEYLDARQTSVTHWHAFLPAGTAIHPMDYVSDNGQRFQVSGEPWQVYNPRTSDISHVQCQLTVVS